jgi:Rieske Fe-S protein
MALMGELLRTDRRFFLTRLTHCLAVALSFLTFRRSVSFSQEKQPRVLATVKIDDHSNLSKVGGFLLVEDTPAGELLVIRTSESEFTSLSTVCPHKHCHVRVLNPSLIQCPCHKSAYRIDGTYIRGPSKTSLRKFVTRTEEGIVTTFEN